MDWLLSSKVLQARKKHICTECGNEIYPGHMYLNERYRNDTEFYSVKICTDCLVKSSKYELNRNKLTYTNDTANWISDDKDKNFNIYSYTFIVVTICFIVSIILFALVQYYVH